jgi:SAM-dependent methyltransferase
MSQHSNCRLCGGESFAREGNIRTSKKIAANKILECLNCSFVFLNDDSHISDFHYEQSLMHDSHQSLEESRSSTKEDDLRRLEMLVTEIKDKNLLEVGSGNSGFLKLAQGLVNSAQGIEPEKKYHEIFKEESLNIYSSLLSFRETKAAIEIIVSFHVIEHVKNPLEFLVELLAVLRKDGKIFIETPNSNDALIKLYESSSFKNFTYWDNHLVLFNHKSFEYMLGKIKGIAYKSIPVQRYGIANHLYWLAAGKPGGHKHWASLETDLIKSEYKYKLKSLQMNDTLFYEIIKTDDECMVGPQ